MKKEIFDYYANKVAQNFGLTQEELFTKNRSRDYVDARWILYYICIERPISKASIQKFMFENGFSVGSTTILRGYKEAKKLIEEDSDYKALVDNIIQE